MNPDHIHTQSCRRAREELHRATLEYADAKRTFNSRTSRAVGYYLLETARQAMNRAWADFSREIRECGH